MQRTICGGYQPAHGRADEPLTLLQAQNVHNLTTGGTVSQQLHWKKKILNKQGLNKCRQNPARQAAVRSFKKYHFTNQDFLLRKYLRSVKKEMKPKQCEAQESSTSVVSAATGTCTSISRPLANNSCIRNRNDTKPKTCTITQGNNTSCANNNSGISSALSSSVMPSKGGTSKATSKNNQHQENINVFNHQLVNIDEESKACERKNWPTYGVEQPTYETVLQESPFVLCSNDLKEIISESTVYIKNYCESIKRLTDLMECTDYDSKSLNNAVNHGNNNNASNNICNAKHNKSKSRTHVNFGDEIYAKNLHLTNGKSERKHNEFDKDLKVNGKRYGYDDEDYNEDDDDDDDDEDEEEEGYEDEYNNHDYDIGCDEDDYDDDDDDDEDDDEDDDDEEEVYNSSGNDIDCKYNAHHQKHYAYKKHIPDNSKNKRLTNKRKPITNTNKGKRQSKTNSKRQNLVMATDSSDSSSVSSSQDNSSVSTETCSDTQTIALHENDDNNNMSGDINDDCAMKSKQRLGVEQQQLIKIRNHEYPISLLHNNPTLVDYLKSISTDFANSKITAFAGGSDKNRCDVQSLMCSESKDMGSSLRDKKNVRSGSNRSDNFRYSNAPQNSRHTMKSNDRNRTRQLQDDMKNHKKTSRAADENKSCAQMKHRTGSSRTRTMQTNPKSNARVKELRKPSVGKNKKENYEPLLSTVCSVEDGLAFLDNQNQQPAPSVTHTNTSLLHNETITLYNNLTSCTLPVGGSNSTDASTVSTSDSSGDVSTLPNSVGSQTTPLSPVRSNHLSVASFQSNSSHCSECKLEDDNLKESLHDSLIHLNELLTSTVILNSLLSGQCQADIAEKTIFKQD